MLTTNQAIIYSLIPEGRDKAISRRDLIDVSGLSDSEIRATIKELRLVGKIITSHSAIKGYYRPETREQAMEFVREQRHRGLACLAVATASEKAINEAEQQQLPI